MLHLKAFVSSVRHGQQDFKGLCLSSVKEYLREGESIFSG